MKSIRLCRNFIKTFVLIILLISTIRSQDPLESVMDINNVSSWVKNDGFHDWLIDKSYNGAFSHGKSGAIFCEGVLWGGKVYDGNEKIIRVNGTEYGSGNKPVTRLFRVRPDYLTADLTNDAASFFLVNPNNVDDSMKQKIFNQYEKDWKEWPGDMGAPYLDADKNNKYDPEIDIPGVPSAPQTIWICYNDDRSETLFASSPTGIETQETYWAYNYPGTTGNIAFKRVKLIYKGLPSSGSSSYIERMYIAQWSDPDIYAAVDDFVGCDTSLNLGYAYDAQLNSSYYREPHLGLSAGYTILQGAACKTDNLADSAVIDFRWRKGYKYVHEKPMSSFLYYLPGWGPGVDLDKIDWGDAALQEYNLMNGVKWDGTPFPDTIAEKSAYGTYLLPGDPVSGTGKIDGNYHRPGDRRMYIVSGPFDMKLNDTVEVVIALVGGFGMDNLNCITELRRNAQAAELIYYSLVDSISNQKIRAPLRKKGPGQYVLYQNYPNPFNASTIIKFDLPEPAFVKLIVYDILGRVVKVLVNESKDSGKYSVEFNSAGLASGIYIYRISLDNPSSRLVYDNLTKSCKLIVIK